MNEHLWEGSARSAPRINRAHSIKQKLVSPKKKKGGRRQLGEVMYTLNNWIVGVVSQCTHTSNHRVVSFKHITKKNNKHITDKYTSIKPGRKHKIKQKQVEP